jgi:hypothetical protein
MPLFIPFLIKGAIIVGKAVIAPKKVAVVSKVATGAINAYGATAVASTAATACIAIGGIYWSAERIDDVEKCYETWQKGDYQALAGQMASLASKMHSVGTDSIANSWGEVLKHQGHDSMDVLKFVKDCLDLSSEAFREFKRPALS